jgi:hypothetical protein
MRPSAEFSAAAFAAVREPGTPFKAIMSEPFVKCDTAEVKAKFSRSLHFMGRNDNK